MYHKPNSKKSPSLESHQFIVGKQEANMSLRDFVSARLHVSKKKAKGILNRRQVFVNRRRTWMAHHSLSPGDDVRIAEFPDTSASRDPGSILFRDDCYIVADKRAGILSNGQHSAEELWRGQLGLPFLAVAHRLDRDTSGCLVLACTSEAHDRIIGAFRRRLVKKLYHTIVLGRLRPPEQTVDSPLDGKRAITHVRALDSNRAASHLIVRIETGRTHQIRRHLASRHHAVLGDRHYATRLRSGMKAMTIGRQMLHASSLEFKHPFTGRIVRVKAPLPHDFRKCLKMFNLT